MSVANRIQFINNQMLPLMSILEIEDNPTNRVKMLNTIYDCIMNGNVATSTVQNALAIAANIEMNNLRVTHDL